MWVFFSLVSIAIVAAVTWLILRYPLRSVPWIIRGVVTYAWLTSISIIAYIPVDVWASRQCKDIYPIYVMWEISFWSTQFLTWFIIPLFMGYVDSGRFSAFGKLMSSLRQNLLFYALLLLLSFFGLMFVTVAGDLSVSALPGTCIALTNMFGLVVVVFMMGYGLVSIPRTTWKLSDPENQLQQTQYHLEKIGDKVHEAVSELERVNLVVHASAQQISSRDAIRPYMDIVWNDFLQSKVSGLDLEKKRNLNDHLKLLTTEELDYALDLKGLVELRRRVYNASTRFEGTRMEYISIVKRGILLTEVCKRRQNGDYSDDTARVSLLGRVYWYSLCILAPIIGKLAAILFVLMSITVIWCELVIIGKKADLSPVHWFMAHAQKEWAVYWVVLLPLVYMFFCTYHTLFNLAAFKFYHLIPKASSPYSLLLNGTLMCRFTAPLSYNFLHVMQVIKSDDDQSTAFSQVMGVMNVLPFFGTAFNSVLPIFLLVHCLLIWMDAWKKLGAYFVPVKFQYKEEIADEEHSAKGRLLLAKEIDSIQHGKAIGHIQGIDADRSPVSGDTMRRDASLGTPLAPSVEDSAGPSKSSSLDNVFSALTKSSSKKENSTEDKSSTRSKKWFS